MADNTASDTAPCQFGSSDEAAKIAHEYAWRWFAYHAQQRLTLFSFSLVALGALAAGCASALSQKWYPAAVAASGAAAFLAFVFLRLDRRNSDLTKLAEEFLKHRSESALAAVVGPLVRLADLSDKPKKSMFYTFGQIVRATYTIFILVALGVAAITAIAAWPGTLCSGIRCCGT